MKVESLMTRDVCCIDSGRSLNEAAQLMWQHNCGSVPVVDENNQVVGMITDRDIAMAAYINGNSLAAIPISIAQSKQLVCCEASDDIGEVEQMMQAHQVHRVPVIDKLGEPVGIISLNDIACAYKAGTRGIKAQDISDTLAAICSPMQAIGTSATVAAA
jgi:CBS domain-containing protein